jgi:anti-sigma factor RsiW
MTCREVAAFLLDYVEGALPDGQHSEFERHLAHCPPCVEYLASYRRTVELTRDATAPEPETTAIPEALVAAILKARKHAS